MVPTEAAQNPEEQAQRERALALRSAERPPREHRQRCERYEDAGVLEPRASADEQRQGRQCAGERRPMGSSRSSVTRWFASGVSRESASTRDEAGSILSSPSRGYAISLSGTSARGYKSNNMPH